MTEIHWGFTGSRKGMTPQQFQVVRELLETPNWLHHGDCKGADAHADRLAHFQGVKVHQHPPEDDKFRAYCRDADLKDDPKPFLDRDQDIVDWSETLIATPSEETGEVRRSGTWATIRMARKKGIRILIVRPSGKIEEETCYHSSYRLGCTP